MIKRVLQYLVLVILVVALPLACKRNETAMQGDASWLHTPPVKGFLKGTRDRDDLSYQRPYVIGGPGARW